jgi:hypothetical protein
VNVTLTRTKETIKPETKILKALTKNPELQQYHMPKETGLSYRTILRTLKPMETDDLIKQIRTEPSKKGGKEKKIYNITFKGFLTYLNSITPQQKDYLIKNTYYYSPKKSTEIMIQNMQPLTIDAIVTLMENLGNQINLQIFKQLSWLREHYGLDTLRAIVLAARLTMDKDKLPSLNLVKNSMVSSGDKPEDIELTMKNFRWMEDDFLRETFTIELVHQLPFMKGNGDLHNPALEQLIGKIISKIEKENQATIAPLKILAQTLK